MAGKGDRIRAQQVTNREIDLRWEYKDKNTTQERKEEILKELEEIRRSK